MRRAREPTYGTRGESAIISTVKVASERRSEAPHPGPILKAEFFDPIGLTAVAFATKVGMDSTLFEEMLAGRASIDVPTAIRLARTLQVPAERIMQMQLKYDFALARNLPELRSLETFGSLAQGTFPSDGFIRGRLGQAQSEDSNDGSFYFQEDIERPVPGDVYAGLHALWRGDRLRIYAADKASVRWSGPVLQNLDGGLLLPNAEPTEWREWFAVGYRADLALGDDHRAFFHRMNE